MSGRIALVTGATRGIGLALAEGLAARLGPADLVLLTGRNRQRVVEAAARVSAASSAHAQVVGRVLDVTDSAAVAWLAGQLGAVDIVLSNASAPLVPDKPQSAQVDEFLAVANGGTHAVLRSFAPILRPGGRLLVLASSLGTLGHLHTRLHDIFDGASIPEIEQALESWRRAIHAGTAEEQGWPRWINVPSKVAQVAAVRAVAAQRRERDLADGTLIASICPGLVDTRLSRPWFPDFSQALSPAQAAGHILDVVFAELDPAAYGQLLRFGKIRPWHEGTPPTYQDQLLTR